MKVLPPHRIAPTPSLTDQLAQALLARIARGELAPGDRLPSEVRLVEEFGVSRTVVREALSRLKSEGAVQGRQGSGVYVTEQARLRPLRIEAATLASAHAMSSIIELRRALEVEGAALAAARATPAQLQHIEAAAQAVLEALQAGRGVVPADIAFHRAIAQASGNPFIVQTLDFYSQFQLSAAQSGHAPAPRQAQRIGAEHQAIVQALRLAQPRRAADAVRRHLRNEAQREAGAGH
ncbi:FadR/GntR family transcriptional regulator [Orrella sp. JC864]|uniref:FadR/GntR family transcriptional regulator n=1 Tax=Orrella sp. JC864 TaxID=3120298 RepID=UPI00300A5F93